MPQTLPDRTLTHFPQFRGETEVDSLAWLRHLYGVVSPCRCAYQSADAAFVQIRLDPQLQTPGPRERRRSSRIGGAGSATENSGAEDNDVDSGVAVIAGPRSSGAEAGRSVSRDP